MPESSNILFNDQPNSWAEVLLPLAIPTAYTYAIPTDMQSKAQVGCRVEVVFGKNKKYAAVIKSILTTAPAYPTKQILNVLDDAPLIYKEQLALCQWISEYYLCSEGEVMNAALPANFKLSSETILIYNESAGDDFSNLDDEEYIVAEALLLKKQLHLTEVQQVLDSTHVYPVIKRMIDKNIC